MDVLQEILKWSEDRPMWQRDALRRLVQQGSIQEQDYEELLNLCKSVHGLSTPPSPVPLSLEHVPMKSTAAKSVKLNTLTHHDGVNALAPNQTVKFGPGLTIVYGQNAAGKSGYTRVLKRACRARGSEEVLSNVLLDTIPPKPSVTLAYEVEAVQQNWTWTDNKDVNSELANVSVFDRHCATVYLDEKTDVAFRPFGLDLFDKLSGACEKLKGLLEKERSLLIVKGYETTVPTGTKAFRMIENVTSLTNLEEIKTFAVLSDEEKKRQTALQKQIQDLQSEDPEKTKKALTLYADRLKQFRIKLLCLAQGLKRERIDTFAKLQLDIDSKEMATIELKRKIEKFDRLKGTHSPAWESMWVSSSTFSKVVFPEKTFPVVEAGASCPLCQQDLDELAKERLTAFGDFMESTAQKELSNAKGKLDSEINTLRQLKNQKLGDHDVLLEIQIDQSDLAATLKEEIKTAEEAIDKIVTWRCLLWVKIGRAYAYNWLGIELFTVASTQTVAPGKHNLKFDFAYDGGRGAGGTGTIYLDGTKIGEGKIGKTHANVFGLDETADVGVDLNTPVNPAYKGKSNFNGKINKITIETYQKK